MLENTFSGIDRSTQEVICANLKQLLPDTIFIMAIFELKFHPEIPGKVVINEAIELGKKYSTKESASFLNGILDSIYKQELKRND